MGILGKIGDVLTGGLAETAFEAVKTYLPPNMSEADKAQMKLQLEKLEMEKRAQANQAMADAEVRVNERVKLYEGTAADLKGMPILGPLMLFLRGSQRIVWGFAALYLDYMWFTAWGDLSDKQETALIVVNTLVLGFLFGERAVKNVTPMLRDAFVAKARAKRGDPDA
ncbi:hypothetical protein P8631_00745 [Guyparkeria sp. 1SP6A2]|nr:hypothetical protein [Guyparkeria sp. 1SP6A2]